MKKALLICLFSITTIITNAQIDGNYAVTGYLFHPSSPRVLTLGKTIIQISGSTYQTQIGDLAGFDFQFTIDGTNHLTSWVSVNSTPAAPSAGFMTADNPGGAVFPGIQPGTAPYIQATYNNTYDPATHTFYMHYGYNTTGTATSQNQFNRQVYEKWVLAIPPVITNVTPLAGTAFTKITITGTGFTGTSPGQGINLGGANVDSATIDSDTKITAWLGQGFSDQIFVTTPNGSDSFPGFNYTFVNVPDDPQWTYEGTAGFSTGRASSANIAFDAASIPYVAYREDPAHTAAVKKEVSGVWTAVGSGPSAGACSIVKIAIDMAGNPVVAFVDSTNAGSITIKRYDGFNWVNLGLPAIFQPYSLAIDKANNIYVANAGGGNINVFKYDGTGWTSSLAIGQTQFGQVNIAADSITGTPYLAFDDITVGAKTTVMKYTGGTWSVVGTRGFNNGIIGGFYPVIRTDQSSNIFVSLQDDNNFERVSVYKFSGSSWSPVLYPYFSKCHSYSVNMAISKYNRPYVYFIDNSLNSQGSFMTVNPLTSRWDTVGYRGFLATSLAESNAFAINKNNIAYVAYTDFISAGKISVKKINAGCYNRINTWTGAISTAWENPANWSCGVLPQPNSDVYLEAGANVVLNSNVTIHILYNAPSAALHVQPGKVLTITGP